MNVIREFNRGKWNIRVSWEYDSDVDLSFDTTGEISKEIDNGDLQAFCVHVTCSYNGIPLAQDSLFSCIYKEHSDFMDHIGSKGKHGSYFVDMVSRVIEDARKEIKTLKEIKVR
jgi:hypothetical protein